MKKELLHGRGIVLLSQVPVERYSASELACLCAGLGSHLGNLMVQSDELQDVVGFPEYYAEEARYRDEELTPTDDSPPPRRTS